MRTKKQHQDKTRRMAKLWQQWRQTTRQLAAWKRQDTGVKIQRMAMNPSYIYFERKLIDKLRFLNSEIKRLQ